MTLELKLIIGFILHLAGDYLLQNDWLAQNKTKSNLAAMMHAVVYSTPFLFICVSHWWFLICFSHFLIDRYRLAVYWIKLVNWNWGSKNLGFDADKPPFMAVWLMIIIDNTFHLLFNSFSIWMSH